MEMVADLVAKESVRRCPRQHMLVGVAGRSVAGDREVVAMDDRCCVEGLRGAEPSICLKHLKNQSLYSYFIFREITGYTAVLPECRCVRVIPKYRCVHASPVQVCPCITCAGVSV